MIPLVCVFDLPVRDTFLSRLLLCLRPQSSGTPPPIPPRSSPSTRTFRSIFPRDALLVPSSSLSSASFFLSQPARLRFSRSRKRRVAPVRFGSDSAPVASSWLSESSQSAPHSATRVVIVGRAALVAAKRCSLPLLASPAFVRSLARSPARSPPRSPECRVSFCTTCPRLPPGKHNFDRHTAGPLGILPNTQRSARATFCFSTTTTHTRLRSDRDEGEEAGRVKRRKRRRRAGGKNVYSVYTICFTPTTRRSPTKEAIACPSRAIAADSDAWPLLALNPRNSPRRGERERERGGVYEENSQAGFAAGETTVACSRRRLFRGLAD